MLNVIQPVLLDPVQHELWCHAAPLWSPGWGHDADHTLVCNLSHLPQVWHYSLLINSEKKEPLLYILTIISLKTKRKYLLSSLRSSTCPRLTLRLVGSSFIPKVSRGNCELCEGLTTTVEPQSVITKTTLNNFEFAKNNEWSVSVKQSWIISLVPKPSQDLLYLDIWRLITLLNSEYTILAAL